MIGHLVIYTHYGTNINEFVTQLKQDDIFYFFINEKRESFVTQYEADLSNGIIINEIDSDLYSEENWSNFYKNIYTHINEAYPSNFNKFVVQIVYGDESCINLTNDSKEMFFIRQPHFAWTYFFDVMQLKLFVSTCKKVMLKAKKTDKLIFTFEELLDDPKNYNFIQLLSTYLSLTLECPKCTDSANKWITSLEYKQNTTTPFRNYTYDYFFNTNIDSWNLISTRLKDEIEHFDYDLITYDTFDDIRNE